MLAAKPVPVVAPVVFGAPLPEAPALESLDAAGLQAAWKEAFGALPMPAQPLEALKKLYAVDLLAGAEASATHTRGEAAPKNKKWSKSAAKETDPVVLPYGPGNAVDGNPGTYWAADDGYSDAALTLRLKAPQVVTHVLLEEVPALGARVRGFAVEAQVGDAWLAVAQGTGIGARKVIRLESPVVAQALRIRIKDAPACAALRKVGAYRGPARVKIMPEAADFLDSTVVRMAADQPGVAIRYTLDGGAPTAESPVYDPAHPLKISQTCLIQAAPFASGEENVLAAYGLAPASAQVVLWPESKLQPAVSFTLPLERGLNYACYEVNLPSLAALRDAEPSYAGACNGFNLNVRKRDEGVAVVYEGWVQVSADGLYLFEVSDDDGAQLWIGDALVVDHDGPHAAGEKQGRVALCAGWHPVRLAWFNNAGDLKLEVKCFGPGCPADGEIKAERLGR